MLMESREAPPTPEKSAVSKKSKIPAGTIQQKDAPAQLRRRAEARLRDQRRGQRSRAGSQKSQADTVRVFHELQVHQVELEMQNAELRDARYRTDTLLEKYTDLYDFAP